MTTLTDGAKTAYLKTVAGSGSLRAFQLVLVAVALAIACTWPALAKEPLITASPLLVSLSFSTVSIFLRDDEGEGGPTSKLIATAGLVWPTHYAIEWKNTWGSALTMAGSSTFWISITWAFFLYPRRRLDAIERAFLALSIATFVIVDLLVFQGGGKAKNDPAFTPYFGAVLATMAFVLATRRFLKLRELGRSIIVPVFLAGVVLAINGGLTWSLLYQNGIYTSQANQHTIENVIAVHGYIMLTVPLAFTIVTVHGRFIQAAVADGLARLSYNASIDEVQTALRSALRDNRLYIYFWAPRLSSYLDASGAPVEAPRTCKGQITLELHAPEGEKLGILVADRELARDVNKIANAVNAPHAPLLSTWLQIVRRVEQDQQSTLHRELEAALWEQRKKFERDLHDTIQVRLSALTFPLDKLSRADTNPQLLYIVKDIKNDLNSILEDLRRLARGVAPALLEEKGLYASLVSLARNKRPPIEVHFTQERFPVDVERTAYNVIAEALNNAVRHADADKIRILGSRKDGNLEIRIIDNGVGGASLHKGGGTGLGGIEARVRARGGSLTIISANSDGTELIVRIPCE